MAISNKIKQLYDAIKSDGGDVGTEDEFNDWFLRPGEEGYNNRKRVYDTFKSDGADVGANYEEFRDWLGLRPADEGAAASTAAPSAPTQQQPSALPGMVSRDIDAPMEIERRDIIADAIDENERLQKDEMAKKAADIDAGRGWDDTKGVWDNFVRIVGGGANESVGSAAPKANVTEHDENMRNLVAERQVLEETRKRRDAGRLKKSEGVLNGTFDLKNNARNIGKGVTDVVTDADFLLNGVIGMQKGDQLIKIDEKIGRGEELTDSELRLVNAAILQGKVESETTVPHGYTAGQTLAEMAPFMAQMALNPANGAASTMAKAAAKQSIKRFGKKAARRIATGVTIAGEVGESAVLANTLQATSTASDIKSRYIGKAYVDENGQIAFDGSKDWSDAIYRGEGAAIIENYTELLGSHFGLMKDGAGELVKTGVTKLGGGKLVNQVSDLVTRIGSTKWAQAIGNIEKRANWNGSIGEMLEEEAGIVLNSMFVGDNKISDLVDPEQQIDIALGVGLFGGFVSGIKTAGYPVARYNARRNLNRADVRASELMGDEWNGLRNLIDDAEEGDLSSIVASVIAEEGMTGQKQRAVVDYARALMTSRGYNISSESVREDGMASAEEVGAEDSFDAGYSITDSQEMVDARLEMERQRVKLVSSMSEDIADEFDADPLDALARTYDPEIREIASKYVNAKMVYDGMIQRVRDDIDGRIAQSDAMIDGRVNRDTGMIQGATLTDGKEVYVVNGNVAMLDDGVNVDVENSDESLIVRDAEGRLEFVAPSQVQSLLAPVDAASEKEAAAEAIRNEIAQSAADKIDGVLHFAPNDVYAVINEDGTQESLTIVGESVDASGVAVDGMVDVMREDGSVVAMNTADIQRMVDESNARRLDERDKARESAEADSGVEAAGAAAEEPRPSALSRIPTDQNGEPLYEQVDADTAWDAFVEQSEGDEEIAKEVVADIVAEKRKALADAEKALKSIGDSKPNASNGEGVLTIQERIAAKMASKRALTDARDAVERAKGVVEHWQSIGDTVKRRAEAEAAERRRQAEIAAEEARQAAERERAEAEEAERLKREALNGVPDWGYDTAADARARGYRRAGTEKVDRQGPIASVRGKEVDVKFSDRDIVKGRVAIIDAGELQPSHIQGDRNPAHFLDEAQPKERNDAASVVSAQKIASNIRPEEITSSVTAYTGAPTVNSRGEVIQGNSRSDALRLMYESQRESAQRYRQYLVDHAADFGLTPEQIVSMESPVLVNVVDVDDNEAIRLGQFVAQDTESGGVERIKAKNAVQKMGDKVGNFANMLLSTTDEEATFAQLVDANGVEVLKWMNQQGFITDTQYASAFNSRGNLTGEAVNDLKGIMYQSIFTGGSTRLEEIFNKMPAKAQRAILATAFRDYDSASADRMIGEIQQSIIAFDALTGYEQFRDATNAEATQLAVEAWKRQYAFDDVSGESYLPSETFSNFALALAAMYKGHTQKHIQGVFNTMYDIIQGTEQDNLFEAADKTPKPLAEAIRRVLNIDYQPIVKTITDNGTNGDTVLDIDSEDGQGWRPGSDADASGAEQDTRVAESAVGGGGTLLSFAERGGQGDIQNTPGRQQDNISEGKARELDDNGLPFVLSEDGTTVFGNITEYTGLTEAPIKLSEGIVDEKGNGYGLKHIESRHGDEIRQAGFKSVEEFVGYVAKHYDPNNIKVGKKRANGNGTFIIQIEDEHSNLLFIELSRDGSYWNVNSGGIFRKGYTGKKKNVEPNTEHSTSDTAPSDKSFVQTDSTEGSKPADTHSNNQRLSDNKVTNSVTDKQEGGEESFIGEQIAAAEVEVNTSPTDKQKEAGNYKKGHVRVGAFDVTIENPKGSVRRGTDATGKKWEHTMSHTYGYIKGTEGVDGDHIDVFLSSDIDGWDGRRVYVVDQYNPDGTFDEHKVMLGFNSEEDAYNAYLSNYESEWEKGRRLDVGVVDIREFEKWVDSSRRKTKAFSEYRSVNAHPKYDRTVPTTPEAQLSAISRIIGFAKSVKNRVERAVIGGITKRQAKDFADNGIEVDESWVHSFESSAVSHNQKHHGNEKIEAERGQIAITEDDYSRIPEILEDYDKVSKSPNTSHRSGNEVIIYEKEFEDGYVYYLEEKRDSRKSLAFQTMYKKKKGTDSSDGLMHNASTSTPKATPDNLSSNSDSKDNALSANSQINIEQSGISTDATKVAEPGQNTAGANVIAENKEKPRDKKSGKAKRKAAVTDGGLFDGVDIPAIAKPAQRSESELEGDSAVYQKREMQTVELVEEIGGVIESRVMMLQLDAESVKPLTMTDVKKMASKYDALEDISDTDLQELVELAMTQLTRSEALINIDGTAEQQRSAYDHIVNLYRIQPSLNARDSERLIKQQYSTPTPFGYVMGQFVRAGGKPVGSMLEPSAGNGALTITVHPSLVHVNDIDDARLANLRKLNYGNVTAQDALLPFGGDKVDVVMTNPPFGTVAEKVYNGVFKVSSLEGQMAINALEKMKDDGRAAIIIGGNTSYRTNGSMNPKDAAFFGYLYSNYNVADVINISGKALYSRSGTGYDVRMILIDGRKSGEFKRVYPPVKAKARAEQVTTFDELYKRIQDDIQQIQQMGNTPADVQREPGRAVDGKSSAHVRIGNDSQDTGSGRRPDKAGDVLGGTRGTDIAEPTPGDDGRRPAGVGNAERGDGTGLNDVQRTAVDGPGRGELDKGVGDGRGRSGNDESVATSSRPDGNRQRLAVTTALGDEKVAYPNQSDNGFTLMSVVPAAQARVLQKSLGEVGDVDQYLVDELGYSSKDELYSYLAAEQIDSVALAIHQMNKGNAFIIGDMTGVGKGRQGAALIRYAVKHGKTPIYFTQKPTLFTDNYRDLVDIGSSNLRPFIMASVDSERSGDIVDAEGNVVYKIPSKKEKERVYKHIMEHGTLPDGYDYVLSTYSQIQNGVSDYRQNEDGTWSIENRKLPKKSKGYTPADHNGQMRRDALARLAEGNITILDESHTVGGDSGCGRYMQMLTSQAEGVTFLSATFAKRADNMPIYAQRTAIAEAGVKASELIAAIAKGGVTLQEIMSKQLVESGQMIRRERSFEGVTIDWLGVEEETDRRQREQFNEVAYIFNAIRNFQDDYITPIIEAKNEAAAEVGATVGHRQGTKDMGVKNVPFASKMYNLVNQLLFALKVDAVADRVIDNLRNGYKPVISFTNTMEGFLSSAPKGEAMDEIPNFSITLMRALDGVMRFTEKDADNNSDGGSISLNELSTEGRNAYNAIREKIMNLSADLPISPMDAIRMKIEDAGYSVAEITGREMQLNRNDAGRYVVEPRKDRDKKAAMRDFNSGKLDVLMINKSGSTGISLHASSKFDDQRQRVMVFAQFQSDINDEVQMRGRIDRSGQVTRGRYEYIMSTIPAEQRIQMMFKAKLKSLDANTTSSQKSKFNEIEIVDYLNKYGDEVVWEYMKEHPELEERLGDPLEMLHDGNDDGGPRVSEKEDTSKKPGCAGKVSRYLAFLSVEEQDEIFREITEAYRVKIQLLDDAGENDLEITTMPLRADTHKKQIWHEGENPGSGNAFADNTYVEEVEVDVLKKPMKRSEIAAATRKLAGNLYAERNGVMDWEHYAYNKGEEIHQFYQTKADEAFGKMKEAGENRIAKAREKAVVAATKARGRGENNFTDAEIQSLADTVANEEREKEEQKQNKRHNEIMAVNNRIQALLNRLRAEKIYVVPQDLKGTAEMFSQTFGTFVGFKFNNGYTLGSSTAIFATLDGRRKVELALSDPAIDNIISATEIAYRYSPKDIGAISMDNWDGKVPTQSRQKRYIITGNLLQALVDTEKGDRTRGNLISFSTIDGETRQGILMGENFKPADLRSSASLSSRLNQIRDGKVVVSENGDVQIAKEVFDWRHRGQYELRVPKSKQRGGIYTMHPELLELVEDGNFTTKGNSMVAYLTDKNIAKAVDMLSRAPFNLTVLEESRLSDVSEAEDVRYRIREDEPPTKTGIGYKVFVLKDGKLYPPMVANPNGEATPVGVWLDADAAPIAGLSKTGRQQVKAGGKGTQGGSGKLAYRPGWHLGVIPYALQFNRKDESTGERELFPKNFVWAEVEYADDVDYQEEAMSYGYNSNGKFQHSYAGLPRLPLNGSYKYRTNPNPETDPWIITGAMKVNRLLTPTEVDSMVEAAGREHQRRQEGAVTDADIERLNDELTAERERSGDGSYSDAEVSMENDPWSKAWGETLRSKREQRAFAKRERERMRAKAVELSERLGVDVEIIEDNSSLEGKRGRSKGWYGVKDGKISVVLGNHVSVADIEKTVLHEAVAHHGLRELLGEHFDEFLDKVYELADNSIKERIALLASRNGWNRRVATEEYLAGLAEDTDFENAKAYNGWWGKIKRLFLDMLSAVGFKHTGVELSDNELRYILWRSYKNMVEPGRFRAFEWEAEDVAIKYNLKAGEYAESSPVTEQRVAEAGELYELNDRFNNELNRQIAGDLPQGHVYDMGMPSEYLLSTGIAKLPIRLSAKILNAKSNLERHAYKLETLRNLVYAIQKPWAIFSYGDRSKAQNMIIGIEDNGRQFLVGISINPTIKGRVLEINSIRNVFPKNNHEWVNWINEGKLLRVDGKKEIQDIIAKLRMNPVAFDYVDLDNAAKIVENFKNPTIREQNNNAGESVDDGVRYRMGDFTPRDRKIAADVYDKMVSSARFEFSEAMQDSMLGLKKLYEAIKGKKGFRIEEVEGYENAYIYENRMSSTNGNEQHLYFIRKMKPLLKAISDICGNSGSERRILTDYMIAKHGLERNVILAERDAREAASKGADYNDELAKCRQRDYSGLTALTGEKDLATAERVAQQMVDDYERDTDTTELWRRVKSATEATLEKMYTSGLMSEERFNQVRGMFQHYIPLRGWDETTSNEVYTYLLQDDHATGTSLTKKAGGRSSKADDPIANIAAMADSAISQGNRNIMKQRFLNFVLNNPSDLVSHNELWLEHDAVNDEWRPVFAELDAADTPADVAKKIEAFEARMKSLQAQHPDKYKRGSEAVNIPYKVVGNNLREHQVLVRRNGVTTVLTINGNPRAAQALNGLTNPDVKAGSHYDEALSVVMYVNRQLSALYTTRNPDFVVSNFMRDMLYSNCMTWIKETPSYALRYHRNFGKLNPAVMTRLLNKYENGTLNSNDYIEHAFEQFMANGGETGFTNLKDIEGHKRAIAKELRRQGNVALRSWNALGMKLDLMNRSVENCARFAAYVTSREMGRSVDRSIYDAKEISVNFNKKGSGGTMAQKNRTLLGKIGAHTSGWGRLLYVFWNAGVQGMTNYGRAAKRNPAKATAAATALFSLGWVIPLLAQAGGGDDDDKNAYYNLPSYIRRSNICFSAGDQWVTIPLPIEYRAIYGLGELAYGAISGNERYSDDELCHEVMAQFSQLLPIDMLEGGGGLSPFIPSLAKPAVEAYVMNKSWTGLPIYKDTGYNKDDPEWTKAYKNADQHLVKASRWLNEVSGGDDFKKGRIDINPAKVEYLLNGMFGGMVSFPSKVIKTVETIGGSREFEWRNIPLANRIIKSGDERTANRRLKSDYYKYKKEAMDAKRLARKYESRGQEGFMEYAEKADFLYNSPEYRRALVFTNYEPDIKTLEQSIDDAGDPNVRKMLETDLYSTMREMVNELDGIAQE